MLDRVVDVGRLDPAARRGPRAPSRELEQLGAQELERCRERHPPAGAARPTTRARAPNPPPAPQCPDRAAAPSCEPRRATNIVARRRSGSSRDSMATSRSRKAATTREARSRGARGTHSDASSVLAAANPLAVLSRRRTLKPAAFASGGEKSALVAFVLNTSACAGSCDTAV